MIVTRSSGPTSLRMNAAAPALIASNRASSSSDAARTMIPVEGGDLLVQLGCERHGAPFAVAQSSGIRIQPWRIAYTTAWVRSLTESFRRMELMWFLTVCSLIDSA